ncbi:hypothetical protein SO802_004935 [Lithocarpus litseifolius]|uniref:Disease resistance R13L4/SHOC-2-like LRR domain-containing protein n=1 Tax=Lithocarpus litseifolius TaxID=425828 RepID=A0AAW2DJ47_9ROSI
MYISSHSQLVGPTSCEWEEIYTCNKTSIAQHHRPISSADVFRVKVDLPGGNSINHRQLTEPPNPRCEVYLCQNSAKSIWKLQKLQHLYLNESHRSKFVSQPRSSSLKNLKTLWGLFLDDFNAIKNGLNKLNNLTKLGLAFQLELPRQEELARWVKGLKYLKSLRLRSVDENGDAQDLHLEGLSRLKNLSTLSLFGKLEMRSIKILFADASEFHLSDLTLSASGLKDDPMQILGSLSNLKSLCFYSDSYIGKQMHFIKKSFSQLQVLRLWNLKDLEKLKVEEEAMQKLRELEIRGCKSLKDFNGLKHLTSLRELKLPNMEDNFISQIKKDESQIFGGNGYPPTITEDRWQPKLSET